MHSCNALSTFPPGSWETAEKLEQLRALEYGYKIKVVETDYETLEVDTPEDAQKAEAFFRLGRECLNKLD